MPSRAYVESSSFRGPIDTLLKWNANKHRLTLLNLNKFFPQNDEALEGLVRFLGERGLVLRKDYSYKCPDCGVGTHLSPCNDKSAKCLFFLQCVAGNLPCLTKVFPTQGTFFERSHLTFPQSIGLMLFFAMDLEVTLAAQQFGVTDETAVRLYSKCRNACAIRALNDLKDHKLGGPGVVMEFDEMKASKHKNKRGRRCARQDVWVVGGMERETKRFFIVALKRRNRASLFEAIGHFVERGTHFLTDGWAAYIGIGRYFGGSHQMINHKRHFVDPTNNLLHTNSIERRWREVRNMIHSHQEAVLESHLLMAVFKENILKPSFDPNCPAKRRNYVSSGDRLDIIMDTLGLVYPGAGSVGLQIPDRVQLPLGAHPFPGKHSMIVKTPPNSNDDSDSNITPQANTGRMNTIAAARPRVNRGIGNLTNLYQLEGDALAILTQMAQNPGVYLNIQTIQAELQRHTAKVVEVINTIRQANPSRYVARYQGQVYSALTPKLCDGWKLCLLPMRTDTDGDCLYNSLSWTKFGSNDFPCMFRLAALWFMLKYQATFDSANLRPTITANHGNQGVMDIIRAAGAHGKNGLNVPLKAAYPHLDQYFFYGSEPTLLALSIATKSIICLYSGLDRASSHLKTVQQVKLDFAMDPQKPPAGQSYCFCKTIAPANSYNQTALRVYHEGDHYVAMLAKSSLVSNTDLIPSQALHFRMNLQPNDA